MLLRLNTSDRDNLISISGAIFHQVLISHRNLFSLNLIEDPRTHPKNHRSNFDTPQRASAFDDFSIECQLLDTQIWLILYLIAGQNLDLLLENSNFVDAGRQNQKEEAAEYILPLEYTNTENSV